MLQALQQLNMPSHADFVSLAERLTNVEMKLDDMDAKLDEVVSFLRKSPPAAGSRRRAPVASRQKEAR